MGFRARGIVRGEALVSGILSGLVGCVVAAQLVGCGSNGEGFDDELGVEIDGGVALTPSPSTSSSAATTATAPAPSATAPSPAASASPSASGSATPPVTAPPASDTTTDASVVTDPDTTSDAGSHGIDSPPLGDDQDATTPTVPPLDAGLPSAPDAALPPVVLPPVVADAGSAAPADAGARVVVAPPVAAPPRALFLSATIDLSRADCGGAAVSASLVVTNGGGQTLTVASATGTQGNGPFSVSPGLVNISPGASATLTVSASVTAQAVAGIPLAGSLVLTTNDPDQPHASVPLSVTPFGATLAWASGAAANFGLAHLTQLDTPIGLSLVNRGNVPASVFLGSASDPQFSLSPLGAQAVPSGGSLSLVADFLPQLLGAVSATVPVTVSGPVCGALPASISLSGSGGAGAISGWPTGLLDFGANPCGGVAALTQGFTLVNSGTFDVHLTSASFSGGVGYAHDVTQGETIPAGGSLTVHVTPPAIPFPSPVPGLFADTLSIGTDEPGDPVHLVSVTESALGAILALDTSSSASFGAFGGIPLLSSTSQSFSVRNTGNAPSSVTLGAGGAFGLSTTSFVVPAGGAQSDAVSFLPTVMGAVSSTLGLTGTSLCQALPSALSLVGVGQKAGLSLSLQSLSFAANCGTSAAPQSLSVSNTGNVPITWSASLARGAGSVYDISPSSGTMNPGDAPTLLTVTPHGIAQYPASLDASAFADLLTLTTNVAGDTPHVVSLAETALGDVLSWTSGALDFGAVPVGTLSASQSLTLTNRANVGSAAASVSLSSTNAASFPLSLSSATVAVQGVSSALPLSFVPGAVAGILGGAIDLATTDPLCAPLPAPVTVSGTATLAQVVASLTSLDFGQVNCGSSAGAQSLTLTNPGTADYHVTGLSLSAGAYFTVSMLPASGLVRAHGASSVTLTVTPSAIPSSVPAVPALGTYSDALTLTTDAAGDVPRVVPLSMGARGAIVDDDLSTAAWGFGSVTVGQVGTFSASLHNAGNAPVTVSVSGLTGTPFTVGSTAATDGSGFVNVQATFTPSLLTGVLSALFSSSATLTVAPAAGAVLCHALPASWTTPVLSLTGTALAVPGLLVPSALSFAPAFCGGTTSSAQTLAVTNLATSTASFTASLEKGTYYHLGTTAGSLAGLGTSLLTVTSSLPSYGAGVLPGSAAYSDRVVITANGTTYYVPLSSTLEGAVLTVSATGTVSVHGALGASTVLTNTGNLLTSAVPTFGNASFLATPALAALLPGASSTLLMSYSGTALCALNHSAASTMSFAAAGLCQPAPVVSLTGCD
jgi:hypothetical protein